MDDQEQIAYLHQRVQELMARERELSMALCRAPRPGEKIRDGLTYARWFWDVRYRALHDTDRPSRRLTEPPSYAATFSEKRKPR